MTDRKSFSTGQMNLEELLEVVEASERLIYQSLTGKEFPVPEKSPGFDQPDRRIARILDVRDAILADAKIAVTWDAVVTAIEVSKQGVVPKDEVPIDVTPVDVGPAVDVKPGG